MARVMMTPEHFETFSESCRKWLEVLGIQSYIVSFRRARGEGLAGVRVNVQRRTARFTLATTWPHEITTAELESCALHECLHVLMAQLCAEALPTAPDSDVTIPADYNRVDLEEEAVVVTLENVLTKLSERVLLPYAH